MSVSPDGALARDVRHRNWPRPWVLGCAAVALLGWLCVLAAILTGITDNFIVAAFFLLWASWWWRRRTAKNLRRSGRSAGGFSFRLLQGTYQPLLAVIWDLRNWL